MNCTEKEMGFVVRAPWYESIVLGHGVTNKSLSLGEQQYLYTSLYEDTIEVYGFNVNFTTDISFISVQIADMGPEEKVGLWNPFFLTPMPVIFGYTTQVEPVLLLREPHMLRPQHRLQIFVANRSTFEPTNGIITVVGVRLLPQRVIPCYN